MKLAGLSTEHPRRILALAAALGVLAVPGLLSVSVTGDLGKMLPQDRGPAEGLPSTDPLLALDLLDEAGVAELEARTRPEALAARAEGLQNLLLSPMDVETRNLLLRDPLGLLELMGTRLGAGVERLDAAGGGFLSPDGEALLLMIRPVASQGPSREFSARLEEDLRSRAASVLAGHDEPSLTFGVTGGLFYARHIEEATRADASKLALVSILAVLLLYLGFYRSFHSLGTMLLLLPYSVLLTLGGPGLLLGELTPMAAGFAAILFGLGIDPAVHLTSRYREARLEKNSREAAVEAIQSVGPAVVVASLTTAAALQGTAVMGSEALAQMGRLAGLGVLVNAGVMLVVLPALWMVLGDRIGPDAGIGIAAARRVARGIHRRWPVVILGYVVFAVACVILRGPLTFSVSMDGFRPASLEPVRVDRAIDEHFGEALGRMVVLVRGEDREAVLRVNDAWAASLARVRDAGVVRAYESLSVMEPSRATVQIRRDAVRDRVDLAAASEALGVALVAQGFRPEPFQGALAGLHAFAAGSSGEPEASAPWLKWFAEKHVAKVGNEWRVATHIHRNPGPTPRDVYDAVLAEAPAPVPGVESYVSGLPLVEYQAEKYLEWGIGRLVVSALAVLLLVLGLHYRRVRVVAVAFVPLAGGLLIFLAVFAVLGIPLSFFAMAGIPLLMGVGIDDHLFMLDRYLERGGLPGRLDDTLAGAGRAILVTTLTTLAAFGVLSLSTFEALASMGAAVSLALAIAFTSSVILLPALLARFLPGPDAPRHTDDTGPVV